MLPFRKVFGFIGAIVSNKKWYTEKPKEIDDTLDRFCLPSCKWNYGNDFNCLYHMKMLVYFMAVGLFFAPHDCLGFVSVFTGGAFFTLNLTNAVIPLRVRRRRITGLDLSQTRRKVLIYFLLFL
jgi:hypothetical protein